MEDVDGDEGCGVEVRGGSAAANGSSNGSEDGAGVGGDIAEDIMIGMGVDIEASAA